MSITTRAAKGSRLTHAELDTNFTDLRDGVALMVPKAAGSGIKVDSLGTPTYAWHDLHSVLHTDPGQPTTPDFVTYRGGIKARQFAENDEAYIEFHIPHDYVPGTEILIHAHWSHTGALVTGGSVTWGFEISYAKGHTQQAFSEPILVTVAQNASTTQYMHMIAETTMTSEAGGLTTLPIGDMEVDGVLNCRVYLDSNDMTVSGGGVPLPFLHFVDLHYQSTNVGTKNKVPSFYA
jgi:hypothetical protein